MYLSRAAALSAWQNRPAGTAHKSPAWYACSFLKKHRTFQMTRSMTSYRRYPYHLLVLTDTSWRTWVTVGGCLFHDSHPKPTTCLPWRHSPTVLATRHLGFGSYRHLESQFGSRGSSVLLREKGRSELTTGNRPCPCLGALVAALADLHRGSGDHPICALLGVTVVIFVR